jgi:hypothetical protein
MGYKVGDIVYVMEGDGVIAEIIDVKFLHGKKKYYIKYLFNNPYSHTDFNRITDIWILGLCDYLKPNKKLKEFNF